MNKILQLYCENEDFLESPKMDGYKSIGVPYEQLLPGSRTQKIEQSVQELGMDYILSPRFVFGRIKDRYIVVDCIDKESEDSKVVVCMSSYDDEICVLCGEYSKSCKIYAPTEDEMKHKVILKRPGKDAEISCTLGFIISGIMTKLGTDDDIFGYRMINKMLSRSIDAESMTTEYNILDEIRSLFTNSDCSDEENEESAARIIKFYRQSIAGEDPKIWIMTPSRDRKVSELLIMINRALFGLDFEIVDRKSKGNFLRSSMETRQAVQERFPDEYGPLGLLLVQGSEECSNVLFGARRLPTMFVMPRGPDQMGLWKDIQVIHVSSTVEYNIPREHTGRKFNVAEVYEFLDTIM